MAKQSLIAGGFYILLIMVNLPGRLPGSINMQHTNPDELKDTNKAPGGEGTDEAPLPETPQPTGSEEGKPQE